LRFSPKRDWLNCQNPMMTNEPIARIEAPVASPSSPSVTFTAFEVPAVMRQIQSTYRITPPMVPKTMKSRSRSRMNEIFVLAGVTPCAFGNCSASRANVVATATCPATFAQPPSPRLCFLRVFRKSSMKPTAPRPTIMSSTSSPDSVGGSLLTRRVATK
jgi:hypothetical protein